MFLHKKEFHVSRSTLKLIVYQFFSFFFLLFFFCFVNLVNDVLYSPDEHSKESNDCSERFLELKGKKQVLLLDMRTNVFPTTEKMYGSDTRCTTEYLH